MAQLDARVSVVRQTRLHHQDTYCAGRQCCELHPDVHVFGAGLRRQRLRHEAHVELGVAQPALPAVKRVPERRFGANIIFVPGALLYDAQGAQESAASVVQQLQAQESHAGVRHPHTQGVAPLRVALRLHRQRGHFGAVALQPDAHLVSLSAHGHVPRALHRHHKAAGAAAALQPAVVKGRDAQGCRATGVHKHQRDVHALSGAGGGRQRKLSVKHLARRGQEAPNGDAGDAHVGTALASQAKEQRCAAGARGAAGGHGAGPA
eukprot:scaffold1130_cov195-Pinguiococcus_pyrenoidosus.AAC.36